MNMDNYSIKGDSRGSLIALEVGVEIPFEVKRIYYIFDTKQDVIRGCHAHKTLKQVLVCVSGACMITLDDGTKREKIHLDKPTSGLFIGPGIWREMSEFTPDAVLLVIASAHYEVSDYIHSYNEFLEIVKTGKAI